MNKVLFRTLFLLVLFKLLPNQAVGQQFYRIKADFTIKEKQATGGAQLIVGTVFYDRSVKKIIYKIRFPKAETWVIQDTTLYKISAGKLLAKQRSILSPEQSIFYYALSGQLANYGLQNSFYKIEKVEKDGKMVISTWQPTPIMKKKYGKVMLSNVNKQLQAVIFHNAANEPIHRQFFKAYINQNGCEFPTEVTQITQVPTGKNIQVTTYKNIVIDQKGERDLFNIRIPN